MKQICPKVVEFCNDCPYSKLRNTGFLCDLEFEKTITTNTDHHNIIIPKWCPLDDYKDPGVRVGVTVMMIRDGKVCLGERGEEVETAKNLYSFPGGRMDYGEENPKTSLVREIEEETGLIVEEEELTFLRPVNEFFPNENKHYVSLVYALYLEEGEPKAIEGKGKCKGWEWFSPDNLPKNIFIHTKETINLSYSIIKKKKE
jgi:8-oxo-dGTP diphosphatase